MGVSRRLFLHGAAAASAFAANDRIQIGVIGAGARSQEVMTALAAQPGAVITGVVDAYTGRVERTRERLGPSVKPFPSHQELIADPSIDAIAVVTPDHWHKDMVLAALRAGKDVYCEKPLTYRSSEGMEIVRAAAQTRRIVQVGSQLVSSQAQIKAREMIAAGKLGQVTMIRAAYNRNTASGAWIYPIPPDASPKTVNWDAFLGPAPKRPFSLERFFRWRCYEDYSGGIATDLFVHLCTSIHFLMNAKAPSRVMAMGQLYRWKDREVPDTMNALLEYPEGFAVNLSSTFNNALSSGSSFQILGTEGAITLGAGLTFHPDNSRENNRWVVESWPKRLEQAYYADPKVQAAEGPRPRPVLRNEPEQFKTSGPAMDSAHAAVWLDAIRTRKSPYEDALAGHRAAACAHMVNRSIARKQQIEWDFAAEDMRA